MGRKAAQEITIIRELVKKIMLELRMDSPAKIMEVLNNDYNKHVSKPVLLKMVKEIKKITLPQELPENLELEYENHPEIISVNNRIRALEEDFKNTDSVAERCRINDQLNSSQETKLKLKKTLKETEVVSEKGNKIQYVVYFDGPEIAKKEVDKIEDKETKKDE